MHFAATFPTVFFCYFFFYFYYFLYPPPPHRYSKTSKDFWEWRVRPKLVRGREKFVRCGVGGTGVVNILLLTSWGYVGISPFLESLLGCLFCSWWNLFGFLPSIPYSSLSQYLEPLKVVISGPPASGKGTQSQFICEVFGYMGWALLRSFLVILYNHRISQPRDELEGFGQIQPDFLFLLSLWLC